MVNMFEDLLRSNRSITEGVAPKKVSQKSKKKTVECKKIGLNKINVKSRKIFEDTNFDDLDQQFAVDPETSNDDEVVLVIDPEIPADEEVPEDAAEEMVGDLVYKCPICGSNYVCSCDAQNESVETDENGVPTECPICGEDTEQILVGEISPVDEVSEDDEGEAPLQDVDDNDIDDEYFDEEDTDVDADVDEESCQTRRESRQIPKTSRSASARTYKRRNESAVRRPAKKSTRDTGLDFDDRKFESFMNRVIRENYHDRADFKVTSCSLSRGTSRLIIGYTVGKSKGKLVAEGFKSNADHMVLKMRDQGVFTESFRKTPSFIVECVRVRNQIVPTSLKYDYKVRVNESLYRVYGRVNPTRTTSTMRK